jgi:hypothetical protein
MTSDLQSITGYRTNRDGSETLAYETREGGFVACVHDDPNCCIGCFEHDHRLFRNFLGDVIARPRNAVTVTVDVEGWSDDQVHDLIAAMTAQAEATDERPDARVLSEVWTRG